MVARCTTRTTVSLPLPDNKTISGLKSDSTKGHNGYNEFVFEDKKSSETIRMRAEKDHDTVIRHAETREIGETFDTPVGSPARSTKIKSGDDQLEITSGDWNAVVGSKITFEAKQEIVFKVGGSKITMTNSSIKIEAPDIKVEGMFITQKARSSRSIEASMSKLRFSSAREVFEAFPMLVDDLTAEPTADPPIQYLQILRASGTPEDGVAFSAYVLNRRETVWWACQCLRLLMPGIETRDQALGAAEALGLRAGRGQAPRRPPARHRGGPAAAGDVAVPGGRLSGGNIAPPGVAGFVPSPPHYTARAVRIAVVSARSPSSPPASAPRSRRCLDGALPHDA